MLRLLIRLLVVLTGILCLAGWLPPAHLLAADLPNLDIFYSLENPGRTTSLALGDFNGDGALDLLAGNREGGGAGISQSMLYLNQRDGQLAAPLPIGNAGETQSVVVGDFNGDGALDFVAGNVGQSYVYLNNGQATFEPGIPLGQPADTTSAGVGDLNGDGALDVVLSSQEQPVNLYFNRNDGAGNFAAALPLADSMDAFDLALGDLNGDHALDLVVTRFYQSNLVYLNRNDGSGGFAPPQPVGDAFQTYGVALGDLNGDQTLDLILGELDKTLVYFNTGAGVFPTAAVDCAAPPANVRCVSSVTADSINVGDMNGDGALDLVLGHPLLGDNRTSQVVINSGGGVFTQTVDLPNASTTESVVVGDLNGDAALDVVAAYDTQPIQVYLNRAAVAFAEGAPVSPPGLVASLVVGDLNRDGMLDLALSRDGSGEIYAGDGSGRFTAPTPFGAPGEVDQIAIADMNGDGKLDLITGGSQRGALFLNAGSGQFYAGPVDCAAPPAGVVCFAAQRTVHLATSDVDGNSALDLLATTQNDDFQQTHLWLNAGNANLRPPVAIGAPGIIADLALGDLDGDGDLDLIAAHSGERSQRFFNDGSGQFDAGTPFGRADNVRNVALADLNGDGALDLAVARWFDQNLVYWNDGAGTFATSSPVGGVENSENVVVGDLNGDGALDLAFGNLLFPTPRRDTFYLNDGVGQFTTGAGFGPLQSTHSIALGDFNRDGALDLAAGYENDPAMVYLNRRHLRPSLPNNPPTLSFVRPLTTGNANFYSVPEIVESAVIPLRYTLRDPEADPVGQVIAFYSLDGGGNWRPALPTAATQTTHLTTSAEGVEHRFFWDTFASGFFGQSDNVVVRLVARPQSPVRGTAGQLRYPNRTPTPIQRPYAAAMTFPFRVRGTGVRVVDGQQNPVSNALVYRLRAGQTVGAQPYVDGAGLVYQTNALGYLQGRGELLLNDQLIALRPISSTHAFTLYHTSAAPTLTGLALQPVISAGVQTLTVSAANPLVLFNLDVALEWDARNDGLFLEQLDDAFQRASEVLFDVSDGQMALGEVQIHQAKANWTTADMVLYASSSIHPRASMGGVVITPTNDIGVSGVISAAYLPGQIRMGPNWDPFGQSQAELTQDWQRALAHELAHYLLFLPDNYLGIENNLLKKTNCQGSLMTNAYDSERYGELVTRGGWMDDCLRTLANALTGRTDWETVGAFFPWLNIPQTADEVNPGPSTLPLAVTQVTFVEPNAPSTTLPSRNFDLRNEAGGLVTLRQAQAYLFKTGGTEDLRDDQVLALGSTGNGSDRVKVRGAHTGDRLCVIDADSTPPRLGCRTLNPESSAVTLVTAPGWQPQIIVSPVTSRTLAITVTNGASLADLRVQVLPTYGAPTSTLPITSPWAVLPPLDPANPVTFTGRITLDDPAFEGFVRVWVEGVPTPREAIAQFFLSAGWGPPTRGFGGADNRVWGPPTRGFGGVNPRSWGANNRAVGAPVASGDGRVTIFNLADLLGASEASSLQALTVLPQLPAPLLQVGAAYRFIGAADRNLTIAFHYLQREAPPGYEHTLRLYFLADGSDAWHRLPTLLDVNENLAAASMPPAGQGIYALLATLEMPALTPGWNQLAYPVAGTQLISPALASLNGFYTSVYAFDPAAPTRWRLFDTTVATQHPDFAPWVNDLTHLKFGHTYWLYATAAVTPYLSIDSEDGGVATSTFRQSAELPPATFYGPVLFADSGAAPVLSAWIAGVHCGETKLLEQNGQWVYKVQVAADNGNGCGLEGRTVQFRLDGAPLSTPQPWSNRQANFAPLSVVREEYQLFLPLIQH